MQQWPDGLMLYACLFGKKLYILILLKTDSDLICSLKMMIAVLDGSFWRFSQLLKLLSLSCESRG